MNEHPPDMSTDAAWEEWGHRDPYFGVITDPKFRRTQMNAQAKREFFDSGQWHVDHVMQIIRRHIDPNFEPKTVLDFGCGVGRTLIGFASVAHEVVGLDVSYSMLQEARHNCDEHNLNNVRLLISDDSLSSLSGAFELIHSSNVFQHITPDRGRELVRGLLAHVASGGVGALHFLYSKNRYADTHGVAPPPNVSHFSSAAPAPSSPMLDPEIQMIPYSMNEVLFMLQYSGVRRFHAEFTDHGGELGLFVFFQIA